MSQKIDEFEGVQFRYDAGGNTLISVGYGEWSFAVDPAEEDGLNYPGGYPINPKLFDQIIASGRTGRQLNDDMLIARQFCLEAYPLYLASLKELN